MASEVKFGINQLNNPTPQKWALRIKIFTIVGGILIGWIGTASFIPAIPSGIMQSILGLLLSVANALLPLFGVETNEKKIPIENVKEMEVK